MSDETKEQLSSVETKDKEKGSDNEETSMEQDSTEISQKDKADDKSDDEDVSEEKKDEGEEEEESEDDEPQVGLLEKPLILEEGKKRERKKVERMTFQTDETPHEGLVIKGGKGRSLGDIPFIEFKLSRTKAEDTKPLHRLLFRRTGSVHEVKKNIRQFSGFPFSSDDPEYEKRLQLLKGKGFTTAMIKKILDILDIPKQGNKDDLITRLMEWLEKPKDSGRKLPEPKRKRKSKGGSEKKTKGKKTKKEKKKKKEKKSKDTAEDDEEEEEVEKEDDEGDDDDEKEESDKAESDVSDVSEDEEDEPPKKKQKKATPKPKEKKTKEKATPKAKTPKSAVKKKPMPKKKAKVSNDEVSDISSESDDEPLVAKQKSKGPPTNDELKDVIKKMLDNANLEQVTMKTVLKDVFSKYPDYDLSDRKDFIKNTVKQIIS